MIPQLLRSSAEHAFGIDVDYSIQRKVYSGEPTARYTPIRERHDGGS